MRPIKSPRIESRYTDRSSRECDCRGGHPDDERRCRNPSRSAAPSQFVVRVGVIDVAVIANALADRPCLRLAAPKFDEPEAFPISGHPIDRQHSRARLVAHARQVAPAPATISLPRTSCEAGGRRRAAGQHRVTRHQVVDQYGSSSVSKRSRSTMSMLRLSAAASGSALGRRSCRQRNCAPCRRHDDSTTGHITAAVIADAFDHCVRHVANREPFAGDAAEKCLAARRPIESDVADDHVVFCRIRRGARRRTIKRPPESPFPRSRWLRLRARA